MFDFLYIYVLLLNAIFSSLTELCVNGQCGYPGIPHGIKTTDFMLQKLNENQTVFYRCQDPNDLILTDSHNNYGLKSYSTRLCSQGKWSGNLPQCGKLRSRNKIKNRL